MITIYGNGQCSKCLILKRLTKMFNMDNVLHELAKPNEAYPRLENSATSEVIVGYFKIKAYLIKHGQQTNS